MAALVYNIIDFFSICGVCRGLLKQGALVSPTIDRTLLDNAFYVSQKTLSLISRTTIAKQNKKHTRAHYNLNG